MLMWQERNQEHPNYARMDYVYQQHHARFKRYVEAHGLTCQACGGRGGDYYTPYSEPPEPCGWCETTGLVTRWLRGLWLSEMRREKQARPKRRKAA
jgi:hypothetical protein